MKDQTDGVQDPYRPQDADIRMTEEFLKLREEMAALHKEYTSLRYDDLRTSVITGLRSGFMEHMSDSVSENIRSASGNSGCPYRQTCPAEAEKTITEALDCFSAGDTEKARMMLDGLKELIVGSCSPCLDKNCSAHIRYILTYVNDMVCLFDRLSGSPAAESGTDRLTGPVPEKEDAEMKNNDGPGPEALRLLPEDRDLSEKAESLITPLASARRLEIMGLLSENEKTFSDISRKTGLRTGHLQFHLRILEKGSYIENDRKTKTYRLTEKGRTAAGFIVGFMKETDLLRRDFRKLIFCDGISGNRSSATGFPETDDDASATETVLSLRRHGTVHESRAQDPAFQGVYHEKSIDLIRKPEKTRQFRSSL